MRNASEMSHLDLDDDASGVHVLCSRVRVDRTSCGRLVSTTIRWIPSPSGPVAKRGRDGGTDKQLPEPHCG